MKILVSVFLNNSDEFYLKYCDQVLKITETSTVSFVIQEVGVYDLYVYEPIVLENEIKKFSFSM